MSEGTTTIVIFGATGDLAKRKLVPALFTLAVKNRLDDNVRIVGASRSTMSDDQFRESMWDALQEFRDLKKPSPGLGPLCPPSPLYYRGHR